MLVLDDLHQLRSDEALQGLERLLAHAPAQLRTVVISRRDPQLGLHRLRLAGRLTEIRGADLGLRRRLGTKATVASGLATVAGALILLTQSASTAATARSP